VNYTFTTSTTDQDEDQVYYKWSWGDGSFSNWIGPYDSGEIASANHSWSAKGTYDIKVKAKDIDGLESPYSDSFSVSIPRNKVSINSFLLRLLQKLTEYFPLLMNLLKQ